MEILHLDTTHLKKYIDLVIFLGIKPQKIEIV